MFVPFVFLWWWLKRVFSSCCDDKLFWFKNRQCCQNSGNTLFELALMRQSVLANVSSLNMADFLIGESECFGFFESIAIPKNHLIFMCKNLVGEARTTRKVEV